MSLAETISDIAGRLRKNSYRNETDVREAIVNRVLYELGWSIYDPTIVQREYSVEKRRVDYALFASGGSAAVFIEVKSPTTGEEGDRQLFEYAFHQGTPFAILVKGREWSFYLPAEQGNYAERRVQKLDFLERSPEDCAAVIERYLRYDRVRDGTAYNDARTDYQSEARKRDAAKAIPRAWADLVKQHDESLIALIAEKVTGLIGSRPADEQVEAFLLTLGNQVIDFEPNRTNRQAQERQNSVQSGPASTRPTEPAKQQLNVSENIDYERAEGRGLKFRFLGTTVAQNNALPVGRGITSQRYDRKCIRVTRISKNTRKN